MVYCGRLLNVGSRSWIYVVLYGIYSLGWRVKNSKDKEKGMSEEANNKLGNKITTLREAHHLTQQDLADRCQCELETIVGLENGELPPSLAPDRKSVV